MLKRLRVVVEMVEVSIVYMENVYRDGQVVGAEKIGVGSGSVKRLDKKEIEKLIHFEVFGWDTADFVDIFYRDPETGRWEYFGSYVKGEGWVYP